MAQLTQHAKFSGKDWGGYCRVTYTALDGTINITNLEWNATSGTTAKYNAWYGYDQNIKFTCGGSSVYRTIKTVEIKQTGFKHAYLNDTFSYTGKLSASSFLTFSVRARSNSPYTLSYNFNLPMSYSQYTISYNANGGSSTPASQTKIYGTALTLAGSISRSSSTGTGYTTYFNGGGGSVSASSKVATDTTTYSFIIFIFLIQNDIFD